MYIVAVPRLNSRPTILIRESHREDGKVKTRTIADISVWPNEKIAALQEVLRGEHRPPKAKSGIKDAFNIVHSRPHGHVAAVLGTLRRLALPEFAHCRSPRTHNVIEILVTARTLASHSLKSPTRPYPNDRADDSLEEALALSTVSDEVHDALHWLEQHQKGIETHLIQRHLGKAHSVLYVARSSLSGGASPPSPRPSNQSDGMQDQPRARIAVLTNSLGCPVAARMFAEDVAGGRVLVDKLNKLRARPGLEDLLLIGDHDNIDLSWIRKDPTARDFGWITAQRGAAIRALAESASQRLSRHGRENLFESSDPTHPDERQIVYEDSESSDMRRRMRLESLDQAEKAISDVMIRTGRGRNRLRGNRKIAIELGKVLGRFDVGRYMDVSWDKEAREWTYPRNEQGIADDEVKDGFTALRTNVDPERLSAEEVVRKYRNLRRIERTLSGGEMVSADEDLRMTRGRGVVGLLACYVEWHMLEALDHLMAEYETEEVEFLSCVEPASLFDCGISDGRLRILNRLLDDLATVMVHRVQTANPAEAEFEKLSKLTARQAKVFELLGVPPECDL